MDFNIFYISANRNECLLQTLLRVAQKSKLLIVAVNEINVKINSLLFLGHPVHCEPQKRASTFVIITLGNMFGLKK